MRCQLKNSSIEAFYSSVIIKIQNPGGGLSSIRGKEGGVLLTILNIITYKPYVNLTAELNIINFNLHQFHATIYFQPAIGSCWTKLLFALIIGQVYVVNYLKNDFDKSDELMKEACNRRVHLFNILERLSKFSFIIF